MGNDGVTRRVVLRTAALATTTAAAPFIRAGDAAGRVVPSGIMVLAWHTNIAPRWLDPLQHDGGATPDNFLNVSQDGLIRNFREKQYDHLALAEHFEFADRWLEFPGFQDPQNPFHDNRVREAVSLAIDREAMNQAECAGLGRA